MSALRRGHVRICFTPDDAVIPDLKCTMSLDLAENSVRRADLMMCRLKHGRKLLGHSNGENEEVYVRLIGIGHTSLVQFQSSIKLRYRGFLHVEPFLYGKCVLHILGKPEFSPFIFNDTAIPDRSPIAILEVFI
jgi:hypothetical protein